MEAAGVIAKAFAITIEYNQGLMGILYFSLDPTSVGHRMNRGYAPAGPPG